MFVWVGDLDGLLIKPHQILMQGLIVALENIEYDGCGKFPVLASQKILNCLSCDILVTRH